MVLVRSIRTSNSDSFMPSLNLSLTSFKQKNQIFRKFATFNLLSPLSQHSTAQLGSGRAGSWRSGTHILAVPLDAGETCLPKSDALMLTKEAFSTAEHFPHPTHLDHFQISRSARGAAVAVAVSLVFATVVALVAIGYTSHPAGASKSFKTWNTLRKIRNNLTNPNNLLSAFGRQSSSSCKDSRIPTPLGIPGNGYVENLWKFWLNLWIVCFKNPKNPR